MLFVLTENKIRNVKMRKTDIAEHQLENLNTKEVTLPHLP